MKHLAYALAALGALGGLYTWLVWQWLYKVDCSALGLAFIFGAGWCGLLALAAARGRRDE